MKKIVAYILWTLFVILATGGLIFAIVQPVDRQVGGTNGDLITGSQHYIVLDANTTSVVEIASPDFFALRNPESGVVLVGELAPIPLGWEEEGDGDREYFHAGPVEIPGGLWIVEKGHGIHVRFSAETHVVEHSNGGNIALVTTVFVVAAILFWVGGIAVISED